MIKTENIDTDQIIPARFLKTTKREGLGGYLFYDWRFDKNGNPKNNPYFHGSIHESVKTPRPKGRGFLKVESDTPYRKPQIAIHPRTNSPGLSGTGVKILVVGNNFGCGSSREHAVWALKDFGFEVIISSSFGDIFYSNALKNGLLAIVLKPEELGIFFRIIGGKPRTKITVNLYRQTLTCHAELVSASKSLTKETLKPIRQAQGPEYIEGRVQGDKNPILHFSIDPFRKACLLKGIDELGYILSFKKEIKSFESKHKNYVLI
jgi:3-isopropylmalate/(R)-2-methylmalate dehydratase small subunit